jgi:hypothetical protein
MTTVDEALAPRTAINVTATAQCAFSVAQDYTTDYFQAAGRGGPEALIHAPWPVPLPGLRHRVAITYGLHLDMLEGGRIHDEIRFHWDSHSPMLPDFRGTVRFRIAERATLVTLAGSYVSPLGVAGRIVDRVIGARIAHASLQDLADRIAAYLGERERTWALAQTA